MFDHLLREVRLAFRSLLRTPGFTSAAVLTLGIGLGGAAMMLTASSAAFRQPLAFGNADRLVHFWQVSSRSSRVAIPLRVARDWEASMHTIDGLGLTLGAGSVNVTNGADAERAVRAQVSSSLFATLGVAPALGRTFSAEESALKGPVAVVISDAFWERMFGRAPDVLGRVLHVEGVPHPIVGVMPRGFAYPLTSDIWTTIDRLGPDAYGGRTAHNFEVVARLRPGVARAQAQDELERVTRQLHEIDPGMRAEGHGVRVADLRTDLLDTGGTAMLLLAGAVACVLLIACANVANLLLARAVTKESQAVLRVALGARPADLLRLFLVESVLLAAGGTLVGAILVVWSAAVVGGLLPPGLTTAPVTPDPSVLGMCALLLLAVGLACGLPSALHAARLDLRGTLATSSRALAREPRGMAVLTTIEVAVACVLLIGAGLLLRSLARLEIVDPGFRADGVLTAPFSLGSAAGSPYADPGRRAQFLDAVLERARVVPGVVHAGTTSSPPFGFSPTAGLDEEGVSPRPDRPSAHYRVIGGAYFQALRVPLRAGRYFTDTDRAGAPPVAIVNETLAARMWNRERPLGRRVRMRNIDGQTDYATVVGVVADMRHRDLTQPPVAEVYFPYSQRPQRTFSTLMVTLTASTPEAVLSGLRTAIREADPTVPAAFGLMAERLDLRLAPARFRTRLLAAFAVVALALSAVGLFAVVSYGVARRTREIGIRMALGADARAVQRLVVRRGMTPVLIGTALGAWAGVALAQTVAGLTFEVAPRDPATYAAAVVMLPAVALLATWLPARRATRIDPTTALRAE